MAETIAEFTVEVGGKTVAVEVRQPTRAVNREAEQVYRRVRLKAVSQGALSQAKLARLVREGAKGLWDADRQSRRDGLCRALAADADRLADPALPADKRLAVAERMRKSRTELTLLTKDIHALERETSEAQGLRAEFQYIVAACTVHAGTGVRYFADAADFTARGETDPVGRKASAAVATALAGLVEQEVGWLPENALLSSLAA